MSTVMNPARSRGRFNAEARLATLLAERARILKFLSVLSEGGDDRSVAAAVAPDRGKINRIRSDVRLPR